MNREDALKMSDNALQDLAQALKEGKSDKLVEYLGCSLGFISTHLATAS